MKKTVYNGIYKIHGHTLTHSHAAPASPTATSSSSMWKIGLAQVKGFWIFYLTHSCLVVPFFGFRFSKKTKKKKKLLCLRSLKFFLFFFLLDFGSSQPLRNFPMPLFHIQNLYEFFEFK